MNNNLKAFLKRIILISIPIILSQLLLNLASLLDTLMVGQLDDISISGVYVATQITFVINLMLFGSIEGASVFFSQYFGRNDEKHLRNVYCYKFISSLSIAIIATICLFCFGRNLVSLYLHTEEEIAVALNYLDIVAFSIIPYAISITISTTLREYHKTIAPMIITLIGTIINFLINYVLIFGKLGFAPLGAPGAAIGTLTERIIEALVLAIYVIIKKYSFNEDFIHSFKIESTLVKKITIKTIPLFFNETLWALSQTILVLIFTKCDAIATTVLPIVQTIFNLIFVVLLGLGNGITIIVGNTIGKNDLEEGQKQAWYSLGFALLCCIILGVFLFLASDLIVSFYTGITLDAREYASYFIKFMAFYLVINGMNTCIFFLLRAGGRTEIVFFFDSFYGYIISIPTAYLLLKFANLDFKTFYVLIYSLDLIKTVIGILLIVFKKWHKNLVIENK